jgi:hypothetical protein
VTITTAPAPATVTSSTTTTTTGATTATTTGAATATVHTNPSKSSPPAPSGARVPATFTIGSGGALSPPTVSAPTGFSIELTLISGDGKAHAVVLRTPKPVALKVPAAGRASVLLKSVVAGTYPLYVDGTQRGGLTVGSAPGP